MGVSRRFVAKPTWQRRTTYDFFRLHDPAFVFLARLFRTRHLRGKQYYVCVSCVCVCVCVCVREKVVDSLSLARGFVFDPSWLPPLSPIVRLLRLPTHYDQYEVKARR
jgi:hypothetical protein